jgi:hypothetical protein
MGWLNIVALSRTLNRTSMVSRSMALGKNKHFLIALLILSLGVLPNLGFGQTYGTATNTITVRVQSITTLQLSAGIININIAGSNAIAGQDQMMTTDQTSTMSWGVNSSLKKVTVSTSLAVPKFTLQLVAVNPTVGTAAAQVTLSTTANDLLTNIGRSSGSCGLLYTAIALASQGTGTDSHTITLTVATQ